MTVVPTKMTIIRTTIVKGIIRVRTQIILALRGTMGYYAGNGSISNDNSSGGSRSGSKYVT
jgi:hypothetical protein